LVGIVVIWSAAGAVTGGTAFHATALVALVALLGLALLSGVLDEQALRLRPTAMASARYDASRCLA